MKISIFITLLFVGLYASACVPAASMPEVLPANHNPVITEIEYVKDVFNGAETDLYCLAEDMDGDNLTYSWTAEEGAVFGSGSLVSWLPPVDMGTYPIKVTVKDTRGGETSETISIRVLTNADGTATPNVYLRLKPGQSPDTVVVDRRVRMYFTTTIFCVVESAASDKLRYRWSSTGGKLKAPGLDDGTAHKVGWIAPGVAGNYVVTVTVSDDKNNEVKGQVDFEVFCCGN
ncbi:MAG: hypothetical protein JW901_09990 [Dehalococcoidia bacterium]|nr:hypothetical protein [Dehalococcoidia bacterium]